MSIQTRNMTDQTSADIFIKTDFSNYKCNIVPKALILSKINKKKQNVSEYDSIFIENNSSYIYYNNRITSTLLSYYKNLSAVYKFTIVYEIPFDKVEKFDNVSKYKANLCNMSTNKEYFTQKYVPTVDINNKKNYLYRIETFIIQSKNKMFNNKVYCPELIDIFLKQTNYFDTHKHTSYEMCIEHINEFNIVKLHREQQYDLMSYNDYYQIIDYTFHKKLVNYTLKTLNNIINTDNRLSIMYYYRLYCHINKLCELYFLIKYNNNFSRPIENGNIMELKINYNVYNSVKVLFNYNKELTNEHIILYNNNILKYNPNVKELLKYSTNIDEFSRRFQNKIGIQKSTIDLPLNNLPSNEIKLFDYQKDNVKWMLDIEKNGRVLKTKNNIENLDIKLNVACTIDSNNYIGSYTNTFDFNVPKGFKTNDKKIINIVDKYKFNHNSVRGEDTTLYNGMLLEPKHLKTTSNIKFNGGIIADDVGLGKTLTTITFLAHKLQQDIAEKDKYDLNTMIILPNRLIAQWEFEIEKYYGKDYFSSLVM